MNKDEAVENRAPELMKSHTVSGITRSECCFIQFWSCVLSRELEDKEYTVFQYDQSLGKYVSKIINLFVT